MENGKKRRSALKIELHFTRRKAEIHRALSASEALNSKFPPHSERRHSVDLLEFSVEIRFVLIADAIDDLSDGKLGF